MQLQELYDTLVSMDAIPTSRVAPAKTAVRQYASMLGYDSPSDCPEAVYNKSEEQRRAVIEGGARRVKPSRKNPAAPLSLAAVRNIKNNISFILKKGVEAKLIKPPAGALMSWKESKQFWGNVPVFRGEYVKSKPYLLKPVPPALAKEIAVWREWSTKEYNRQRPGKMHRRPKTFDRDTYTIRRLAGFLVKNFKLKPESITLATLVTPSYVDAYVEWYIETQGKVTAGVIHILSHLTTLAKYLKITAKTPEERARFLSANDELSTIWSNLPLIQSVRDKSTRWLSLEELDAVGQSMYPLNARRFAELSPFHQGIVRRRDPLTKLNFRGYALYVEMSLLIRLLTRLPLRQRNIREMRWNQEKPEEQKGTNLYKLNGQWRIKFRGKELKVAARKGVENKVDYKFPEELVPLLEEYLTEWRPLLLLNGKTNLVFINRVGKPWGDTGTDLRHMVVRATYRFKKVAVPPHLFRDIWATEYIKATGDFIGAAYRLGDTVETVMKHYAHLMDRDADAKTSQWCARKFSSVAAGQQPAVQVGNSGLRDTLAAALKMLSEGRTEAEILDALTPRDVAA